MAKRIAAETALPKLRVDDLNLAWWAGTGAPTAIAAFCDQVRALHDRAATLRDETGRATASPLETRRPRLRAVISFARRGRTRD